MNCPKISIIVPVYKAEKYIHKCVNSLLAQTFIDYEVLLIDDGSPDKSGVICDEYARVNSRVKVFHKENGGVSSARQYGLEQATGEYVIHADPDDWVDPEMLTCLYNKASATNADMVICDYYINANGKSKYCLQSVQSVNPNLVLCGILNGSIYGSCWNKLIRRSFIYENNIYFHRGLNVCEDRQFIIEILLRKPKIEYINKAFYHYCTDLNDNSLVKLGGKNPSYKINEFFIDYAIKNFSAIPIQRDLYIADNLLFVISTCRIPNDVFRNCFKKYEGYIDKNVPLLKRLIIKSSLNIVWMRNFWQMLLNFQSRALSVLFNIKKDLFRCFHTL